MRPKRSHVKPIEAYLMATQYREGMPIKEIMAKNNCALTTILKFARYYGVEVPRPRQPRKTSIQKPKEKHNEAQR